MKKALTAAIIGIFFAMSFLTTFARPAYAIADPPIFSCTSPAGDVAVSYVDGPHGIAGDPASHVGMDTVYSIDEAHTLQCFCPQSDINGTASNWVKTSGMSQDDVDFFVRRGWVFVPSGAPWGLSDDPYLVKNDSFSCGGQGGGSSGDSGGGSSSSSSSSSSSGDQGSGASSPTVYLTSLAYTGNDKIILLSIALAAAFSLLAYRLSRE